VAGAEHQEEAARTRAPATAEGVAPARPGAASALLSLQRAAGNAAVLRALAQSPPTDPGDGTDPVLRAVESLSGQSLDGVRVQRDSAEPGRIGAHAFATGDDVHLGPGQERHLGHELWHVAQQRAGRVAPTGEVAGRAVNLDAGLEREADVMGTRAILAAGTVAQRTLRAPTGAEPVVQGAWADQARINAATADPVTAFADYVATTSVLRQMFPEQAKLLLALRDETSENRDVRARVAARLGPTRSDQGMWGSPQLLQLVEEAASGVSVYDRLEAVVGGLALDEADTGRLELVRRARAGALGSFEGEVHRAITMAFRMGVPAEGLLAEVARAVADHQELTGGDEDHDESDRDGPEVPVTFKNVNELVLWDPAGTDEGLRAVFADLARSKGLQPTDAIYRAWISSGVLTKRGFVALWGVQDQEEEEEEEEGEGEGEGDDVRRVIRRKRTPGSVSYQESYETKWGTFKQVAYTLDTPGGNIDFSNPTQRKKWQDPVDHPSYVDLEQGVKTKGWGLLRNGKLVKLKGASRSQHFSVANRIKKIQADGSPAGWTWHHLSTPFKMVLVERSVHQKHGHNGGILLW
jgi:hypothetical protein